LNVKEKENIEDPLSEISEEEAKKINEDLRVGDFIETGFLEYNPGRIAAQTAKQVVLQKLREAERDLVFGQFSDKEGQVITGTVQRMESKNVFVDIGRTIALMPISEQTFYEKYRVGQKLKFYVTQVQRTVRGPEIIVSRTHPDLLRKLFETEVPEINTGVVEIKALSREAGARSKVAVASEDSEIDAVGACVGLRGIRIQNVVNELLGEKIDVIDWNEDPKILITNSLSPASVSKVNIDEENASAIVIVPKKQLSLAIGREGQNARLAAKLTNWKIDVQAEEEVEVKTEIPNEQKEIQEQEIPLTKEKITEGTPEVLPIVNESEIQAEEIIDSEIFDESKPLNEEEELRVLEKEIEDLEKQELEEERKAKEKETILDFSSEEIWNIGGSKKTENSDDEVIRFAEDIESVNVYNSNSTKSKKSNKKRRNKR
jgi:N utilization substance protein A